MAKSKSKSKSKRHGNPFFAMRMSPRLLAALTRYAKQRKTTREDLVRSVVASLTGVDP